MKNYSLTDATYQDMDRLYLDGALSWVGCPKKNIPQLAHWVANFTSKEPIMFYLATGAEINDYYKIEKNKLKDNVHVVSVLLDDIDADKQTAICEARFDVGATWFKVVVDTAQRG